MALRQQSGAGGSTDDPLIELRAQVSAAQAEMDRLIQVAELKEDPLRYPIEAIGIGVGTILKLVEAARVETDKVSLTDRQVEDMSTRLMGACQGWAWTHVRASYWRNQAILGVLMVGLAAAGFGAGWWLQGSRLSCADQADGSRACWIYVRPPAQH
jgi:hypothetical protein